MFSAFLQRKKVSLLFFGGGFFSSKIIQERSYTGAVLGFL